MTLAKLVRSWHFHSHLLNHLICSLEHAAAEAEVIIVEERPSEAFQHLMVHSVHVVEDRSLPVHHASVNALYGHVEANGLMTDLSVVGCLRFAESNH